MKNTKFKTKLFFVLSFAIWSFGIQLSLAESRPDFYGIKMKSESFARGLQFDMQSDEPKFLNADQDGFDADIYAVGQLELSERAVAGFRVTVFNRTEEPLNAGYMFREFTVVTQNQRRYIFGEPYALFRENTVKAGQNVSFNISFGDILLNKEDIQKIICSFDMGNIKIVLLPLPKRPEKPWEPEKPKKIESPNAPEVKKSQGRSWTGRHHFWLGSRDLKSKQAAAKPSPKTTEPKTFAWPKPTPMDKKMEMRKEEVRRLEMEKQEVEEPALVRPQPKTNIVPGNSSSFKNFEWPKPTPMGRKEEGKFAAARTRLPAVKDQAEEKKEAPAKARQASRNFWWGDKQKTENRKQKSKTKEEEPKEPTELPEASRASAEVLMVDSANGFLVANVGADDGLKEGSELAILRKGRFIGKAVVRKLRPDSSAAVISPEWAPESILPGDSVTID